MNETNMLETAVSLREITHDNLRAILRLRVHKTQERFVADNATSLAEAHFQPKAWFRAIYAGETPVGFIMLYDDPEEPVYFLWRLMIDEKHQGKGYARQALDLLVAYVKTRPRATQLLVSYVPGIGSPYPFYRRYGFVYNGQKSGTEFEMTLPL